MVIFTRRWDGNDFDRGHHYFQWFFNGFAATGPSPLNVLHVLVFDLSFLTFVLFAVYCFDFFVLVFLLIFSRDIFEVESLCPFLTSLCKMTMISVNVFHCGSISMK